MAASVELSNDTASDIESWLGEWLFGGALGPADYLDQSGEDLEVTVREWLQVILDTADTDENIFILAGIAQSYIEGVDIDWQGIYDRWIDTPDEPE